MQDRRRQFDEIFLQRTAGPYMWVKSGLMRCSKAPYSITSLARASNGRLMSGLQLPADAAMAYALFGLGPEAHQER